MSSWNSLAFSMIQQMLVIWSLVPLPFLKPACTSGRSQFTYCWSPKDFEHYLASMWNEHNCTVVWHSLTLPFFGTGMKADIFQSKICWVFQICRHMESSTLTAWSFRIWNRSTGIPSPPLALFTVMHPKVHLTSHSRISGSRWVITPPWLSGS